VTDGDSIIESLLPEGGLDTVISSAAYLDLYSAGIENVELAAGAFDVTANSLNNVVTGNELNNFIYGGEGDDTLAGAAGDDSLIGDLGDDRLYGGDGFDLLDGGNGNDLLDGGADSDVMMGGIGDDTYVYTAGDTILESVMPEGGVDTVISTVEYLELWQLGGVENAVLSGNAIAVKGNEGNNELTGNALDNYLEADNGDDSLYGGAGNDYLSGGHGNDYLEGGDGNDTLEGGDGDDTYLYTAGDTIWESVLPEGGVDTVITSEEYVNLWDWQFQGIENVTLTGNGWGIWGNDADNVLTGNALDNHLVGNAGNDTLDGGEGIDMLEGGEGDDIYVYTAGDVIYESWMPEGGVDTVITSMEYVSLWDWQFQGIENATLTGNGREIWGTDADNVLTGNTLDNHLVGNAGNDTLDGGEGIDTLDGGAGDDTYVYTAGDIIYESWWPEGGVDTVITSLEYVSLWDWQFQGIENITLTGNGREVWGNDADNVLTGNALDNHLVGNAGNDTLDGGEGFDVLEGGQGDDTYVYTAGDTIYEYWMPEGGVDTVITSLEYVSLWDWQFQGIENVTLTGNGWGIWGNNADNVLIGNALDNHLVGEAGNDTLDGGEGIDMLDGGEGDDIYVHTQGDMILESMMPEGGVDTVITSQEYVNLWDWPFLGIENVTLTGNGREAWGNEADNVLTGNALDNHLVGGFGNDTLDGGEGIDMLEGGQGNDTYVYTQGDMIYEDWMPEGGVDTVITAMEYINLWDWQFQGIENATLTGNGREIWGNDADNVLTGNALDNHLVGNAGNDTLDGGEGIDTLNGGQGDDTYVYTQGDLIYEDWMPEGGVDTVITAMEYINLWDWQFQGIENATLTGNGWAIWGNDADNVLTGNALDNYLAGNAGNDTLDGGEGFDVMEGGAGDDTYVYTAGDTIYEDWMPEGGVDTLVSTVEYVELWHFTGIENAVLADNAIAAKGNQGNNELTGNALNNSLEADDGDDILRGEAGDDFLNGGYGKDVLVGGQGIDFMDGGEGEDQYVFTNLLDLSVDEVMTIDTIVFDGLDRIDLSGVDANVFTSENEAFSFIGESMAFTDIGQLRFSDGQLFGNVDGDLDADFAISLVGVTSGDVLTPANLIV
ncbi:hypothetical protein ACFPTX_11215, partial [Pseudomonas sp. GCM10022188]|uniref:calcium-binding protein n=1 Tax=Pseudomonas sp. GCM10022188 TaxID=3252651 RepID=UPI003609C046|nr:hypothetical protein [Pseudomonas oryzagri]